MSCAPCKSWCARAWTPGPIGLSTGLDYIPSLYADAREIAALCEPIVAENGVYVTHMRGYGPHAAAGMREVYDIARATGVPAHVSHYNGRADLLLPLIDEGRALGLDLTFDTYPYLAGSTILGMVALPGLGSGRRDRAHRRAAARPGRACPAQLRMVLDRHALRAREHHDRDGGSPRLALGRGTDRHGGGRRGKAGSRRFRVRHSVGLRHGRRNRGLSPRRSNRGRRPGDPPPSRPHGGLRRHLLRRLPAPARLGSLCPLPGLSHSPARRLFLARGRHPPGDARRPAVSPDRPRPDPPWLRRRYRRSRPGQRDRPLRPTPPAAPWPRGSSTCWSTGRSPWKTASRPGPRLGVRCGGAESIG